MSLEGPFWITAAFDWQDDAGRATVERLLRIIDRGDSILGVSAHFLAFARKL